MAIQTINQSQAQGTILGNTSLGSNYTSLNTSVNATGLTITVTVPNGGRKVKVTTSGYVSYSAATGYITISIWDGVVGSGTQIGTNQGYIGTGGASLPITVIAIVSPAAGSKTYNVGIQGSVANAIYNTGAILFAELG